MELELAGPCLTSGCLQRRGLRLAPSAGANFMVLVDASSAFVSVPSSEHFAGPKGEHYVRSATPGVSGRRRHSLAALGAAQLAAGGDPSFMNNVPDPTLAGKDLPTFKFALEKSDGKVIGNSYGKEGDGYAIADLQGDRRRARCGLSPARCGRCIGHPNADEWQSVVDGEVSVTLFGSHGRYGSSDCRRATSATSRKGTVTRSRMPAAEPRGS
jgi:hypothetical protein